MKVDQKLAPPAGVACMVLLLAATGCVSASRESRLLQERTELSTSTAQLRVQVRSLVRPFSGIIEGAGDQILRHATTPEERIAALRFKIDGVPAFQGALLEPDPMAAAFDTAALVVQTRLFIEEGPGKDLPPPVKAQVLGSLNEMLKRLHSLGEQIGATPEGTERFWSTAEGWARAHPITGGIASRESTRALFAEYVETTSGGLGATARRVEESVAELAERFDLYGEYVVKQVRWQGELMLEESLARDYPRRALQSLDPVAVELSALPVDIDAQRELILGWLRGERLETLDFARVERQAIAGMVAQERQLVLEALRTERKAILVQVAAERAAAMEDLAGVLSGALEDARAHVIDHLAWRVVQILAVVLPVSFLGAWFLIWYAKRG